MDTHSPARRAEQHGGRPLSTENHDERKAHSDAPQDSKKTYETPLLVTYGSVADLTRGLGSGETENGGGPF